MIKTPFVSNMYFDNESSLEIEKLTDEIEGKLNKKIDLGAYELYCRNKFRKPIYDIYALFAPFNEAIRAFYPFVPFLKNHLKKGDIIVDVWNRTGWSTALLAALFPEQKIISVWEGNTDVLGYNGFAYWFGNTANVEIHFSKLNEKLPFENQTISVVFGHDVLHRQLRSTLLPEILRIVKQEGFVFFPHVHMANNEPEPYFKRGGDLIHGEAYAKVFSQLSVQNKKAYVFSEPDLFKKSLTYEYTVLANPSTKDYNGLIAISPLNVELEKEIKCFNYFDYFKLEEAYLLVNPLLELGIQNEIILRNDTLNSEVIQLIENHPVYKAEINKAIGYKLTDLERQLFYWASKCKSCAFILETLKIDEVDFRFTINKLQSMELWQILPLNESHIRLQHYYSRQEFLEAESKINLRDFWKRAVQSFPNSVYVKDRNDHTFYTYSEFNYIIHCVSYSLLQSGIKKGDKIILYANLNFESIALFWACTNLGIVFIPLNLNELAVNVNHIIEQNQPKLVFLDKKFDTVENWQSNIIYFDGETDFYAGENQFFSNWLLEPEQEFELPVLTQNDQAVVLYSSGSSGMAKGVNLTHGQLFQSAVNMVLAYQWKEKDQYLSFGNLEQMSSLRNACLVTAESGATCIIPSREEKNNIHQFLDCIYESDTSILVASPSLLNILLASKDAKKKLEKVRQVLSTGSQLTKQLKMRFYELTGKKIHNYYGLTETTGFCIGELFNQSESEAFVIGKPFDCLVNILDEKGEPVPLNEFGELHVYSGNIAKSYVGSTNTMAVTSTGWFNTGDVVKLTHNGTLELVGRNGDFIKNARSEIVYFKEIEAILLPNKFIKDLCTFSFIEDETEKLALLIVVNSLGTTHKNIVEEISHELSNCLGPNKAMIKIKVVDEIPRKINGKFDKNELLKYI